MVVVLVDLEGEGVWGGFFFWHGLCFIVCVCVLWGFLYVYVLCVSGRDEEGKRVRVGVGAWENVERIFRGKI